jgi:hypothetical protein
MPIFQRMHLEKSPRDVVFQSCNRAALRLGIKLTVAEAACEKAAKIRPL